MAANNIITANLTGRSTVRTKSAYQFDYGQVLVIEGVELPESYQVHFCNEGDDTTVTVVGDATGVSIPDACLEYAKTIYAFIYLHTGESDGETVYEILIPVKQRARPTDVTPTPQQHDALEQALAALDQAIATIQGLTVSAVALEAGAEPTATKTIDPETGAIDIQFGIPVGN